MLKPDFSFVFVLMLAWCNSGIMIVVVLGERKERRKV